MERLELLKKEMHFLGVGIRKNPKGYLGFPKGKWLLPCFIFLEHGDSLELCGSPLRVKDWLIKEGGSIKVFTSNKKYSLSRREVSHIYGPFKFEQSRYLKIKDAINLLNVSEVTLRNSVEVIEDRVSTVHLQMKFGPLCILPREEQQFKRIIVKDIYRNHSGYGWVATNSYKVDEQCEKEEEDEILIKLSR
ncbi:hypothetical protein C162_20326 [Paenibacillus sp. FSL R7-269]|uniref:hypothetical protein n=1 Tax=Paenibacillus sp. FSL R7-269 TaxID=1226755 RepID=UPI0003E2C649|nr:hypothetical protein [Paenibacillus sp. FSL R7-269]ETT45717.1 hypothetical protein C162_20326 [Paenibacillus sp. FSL R7-269]